MNINRISHFLNKMGNSFQSFQQKCYFYMFHYCCQIYFWFQKLLLSFQKRVTDPSPGTNWINVYERIKADRSKNHYRFHYEDESENFAPFLEKEYDYFYKNCIKSLKNDTEQLFIAKEKECYLFLQFQSTLYKPEKLLAMPESSNIDFVFVEYNHPCILKEIELIIPRGYYLVGNELFSPAFILRMLQMQSIYFVFDDRYSIRIIDHEVKTITFGFESYVLIQKDDYKVKKCIPVVDMSEEEEEEEDIEEKEDKGEEDDYLMRECNEEQTVPFTVHEIMRILFPK